MLRGTSEIRKQRGCAVSCCLDPRSSGTFRGQWSGQFDPNLSTEGGTAGTKGKERPMSENQERKPTEYKRVEIPKIEYKRMEIPKTEYKRMEIPKTEWTEAKLDEPTKWTPMSIEESRPWPVEAAEESRPAPGPAVEESRPMGTATEASRPSPVKVVPETSTIEKSAQHEDETAKAKERQ